MKIDITPFDLEGRSGQSGHFVFHALSLSGFENRTRFSLFHEEGKLTVFWLQSLDDPALSFRSCRPGRSTSRYEIELSDAECAPARPAGSG